MGARSFDDEIAQVKSRDRANRYFAPNIPTKYQLPTPYCIRDIARTRFSNSRSLRQGERSNQGHTMMLHTYTPLTNVPMKYQLPTPYGFQDTGWTNFFPPPTLKGCGVNMVEHFSSL